MATDERWCALRPYVEEMLDLPDGERAAWVASLGTRDPSLAAELGVVLAEHRALDAERFLDHGTVLLPHRAGAGATVGAYTLVRPIGEGGMGSVWLAERSDGRFDRRVAVKFLNLPARGGEDRFTREGRILGRLAHPRIAQLLDAGVTADGHPYLVLEYVDGQAIDRYCDAGGLDLEARVRLFLLVLDAVAHAHANLIVHRDIKPSNVFVRHDGELKLLDFGIATLLADEVAGAAALPTRDGGVAMTLQYAAPEQLTGGAVTTATDLYSLGVLLYLLVTGQHPTADARRSAADFVRAIVDAEPKRASDAAPDQARRQLRGDLDTILAKSLKKDPAERYASVTALADDLRRYLRHEPISARPDSILYRGAKFVRRNRVAVALATAAVVALAVGLYVTNRERVIAERRFAQLRQLSRRVFEFDQSIRNLPGSTDARKRLAAVSLEYLEGLAADVRGNLDLAQELSEAYRSVARVQGVPTDLNLGDFTSAEQSLKKADGLADLILASRPRDPRALLSAAGISQDRMILAESERRPDALLHARRATERVDAFLKTGSASEAQRSSAAVLYMNVAIVHVNSHRYDDAIRSARRDLEVARTLTVDRYRVSGGLSLLASALRFEGDLEGALRAVEEARATAEAATYSSETARMIELYGVLLREGLILGEDEGISLNRPADAIATLERAFELTDAAARRDSKDAGSRGRAGTAGRELGNILRHVDPGRAVAVYDAAIARLSEIDNLKARRDRAMTLAESSYALRALHGGAEAARRIDAAVAGLRDTKDLPAERINLDSPACTVLRAQADHLGDSGRHAEGMMIARQLLEAVMRSSPDTQNDLREANALSRLYQSLERLHAGIGDDTGAREMTARRTALWRHWQQKLPRNPFVLRRLGS
jgi:tetratricopeptide (TPR) repeat protein